MEYLKKFYDLLGTEMGNVRPLVNEDSLPIVSDTDPSKYVTPNKGTIMTNFGIITINNDLNLTVNGKVMLIAMRKPTTAREFRQANSFDTLNVLGANENGNNIVLKLKLKSFSSEKQPTDFTLDLPEDKLKQILNAGDRNPITISDGDNVFNIVTTGK